MEASSSRKSSQSTTTKPSSRFCSSSISSSSTFGPVINRTTSPTRVSIGRSVSPSVRFSASRRQPLASHRSLNPGPKRTCMCSPTTHPGSFRCSLHKNNNNNSINSTPGSGTPSYKSSHQLNMRRSAMTNSLVRIGTVEGDLMKRALATLIRPSSHNLRRRFDFQKRPSRLSLMSKA